jgi:HK97 gp10 family phage protein
VARSSSVTIVFNGLPTLSGVLRANAGRIVRATALGVETTAKQLVPVDTGALRASIHTASTGELSAAVGPSLDYGLPVELGGRGHAPQPYMLPAAEQHRQPFVAAMKKVLD